MDPEILRSGESYSAACALLWAIAVILFRKSGERTPPVALNLFKAVVGLGLFTITLPVLGIPFFPPEVPLLDWVVLLASGALGIGVADTLFFASLNRLGAGRSAIVDCLYSPFVVICSLAFLDEPVGPLLLGAIALMGVAIVAGTWNPGERPVQAADTRMGLLLGIASMFLMAVGIVMAKPVLDRVDAGWAVTVRLVGGVTLLAIHGMTARERPGVLAVFRPGGHWRVAVPAAIVGTYFAVFLWTLGMKHTYTTTASVLNELSNVFVLPLAAVFLKEALGLRHFAAIGLGFAAGVLAVL